MNNGTKEDSDCFLLFILATDASVYRRKKRELVDREVYDFLPRCAPVSNRTDNRIT
jgi:hypothetical protein